MGEEYLYEERIIAKWLLLIFVALLSLMLFFPLYQMIIGPLGDEPAPNWFYLLLFLVFFVLAINFYGISIKISHQYISVNYGLFKKVYQFDNIEAIRVDDTTAIKYGGAGIRVAKIKGKRTLIFNVIGGPRIVLALKEGRFQEFVFSTRNPDRLIETIKNHASWIKN
jgi:hypothetical protein